MRPARHVMLALLALGLLGAAGGADDEPYGLVSRFGLTERSGRAVTNEDLLGKVWVADFIFTTCGGPCPRVTQRMANLERHLASWPGVRLVTFTVNPSVDTPEVLSRYADFFGADRDRWLFLTGDRDQIYTLITKSFRLGVEDLKNPKPGFEIIHSTKLVLVDAEGRIRGYFNSEDDADLPRLERQVKLLAWPYRLPAVNAILNATSALLLLLGYAAIRRRAITLHKVCMVAAFVVSVVFLGSYLYYHFVVRQGQPTRFPETGSVRLVYLAILLSHTVLAVVVAPLALVTLYQGFRDARPRHVRVARWTLPLWLYVSVTGVVVYWMLYHLYPPPL